MNEAELKSLCAQKLKWSIIPDYAWEFSKNDGYVEAVLDHWESDRQEAKANLKLLIKRLRHLQHISPSRKPSVGRSMSAATYQPTEYEIIRQEALRQFYEINFDFDPRVVSFRTSQPAFSRVELSDVGTLLTNPLNWLLGSGDIQARGLSPINDIAVPLRRQYIICSIDGSEKAVHKISALIPQRNLQFDVYHDVEDRIILQNSHAASDAHAVKASESIPLRHFFEGHFLQDKIFPPLLIQQLNEAAPYIFRKTLLGQCLEISRDLASLHGLDERDVLLFLLTGCLPTPSVISSACREIPVFDDDNQLSSQTSAGPVRIIALPQIAKQNVSSIFGQYQRDLFGKDNRPIKNLDLFGFVIRNRATAKSKGERLDWASLREQWEQSSLCAKVGPRTQSVNGFRMAYVNAKKALFPAISSKYELYGRGRSDT